MKQNRTKMASAMLLKLKAMRNMNLAKMEVEDNKPATDFNNNVRVWE